MYLNYFDDEDAALELSGVCELWYSSDPSTKEFEKYRVLPPFKLELKADIIWWSVKLKTSVLPELGQTKARYIWEYLKDPESGEKTLEGIPIEEATIIKRHADKFIALLCGSRFVSPSLHLGKPIDDLKSFREWFVNSATKLDAIDLLTAIQRWKTQYDYCRDLEGFINSDLYSEFYASHRFDHNIHMLIDRLDLLSDSYQRFAVDRLLQWLDVSVYDVLDNCLNWENVEGNVGDYMVGGPLLLVDPTVGYEPGIFYYYEGLMKGRNNSRKLSYFDEKQDLTMKALVVSRELFLKNPYTYELEKHVLSFPFRLLLKADIIWWTLQLKSIVWSLFDGITADYIWEYLKDPDFGEKKLEDLPGKDVEMMKYNADRFFCTLCCQDFVGPKLLPEEPIDGLKLFREWFVNSATKLGASDLLLAMRNWRSQYVYCRDQNPYIEPADLSAFYASHQFHPNVQMLIDRLELWSDRDRRNAIDNLFLSLGVSTYDVFDNCVNGITKATIVSNYMGRDSIDDGYINKYKGRKRRQFAKKFDFRGKRFGKVKCGGRGRGATNETSMDKWKLMWERNRVN